MRMRDGGNRMSEELGRRGIRPNYTVDTMPGEAPEEESAGPKTFNNRFFDQGGDYASLDHQMKVKLSELLGKRGSAADKDAFAHQLYDEGGEYAGIDHDMKGKLLGEWGDEAPIDPMAEMMAKKKARQARLQARKLGRVPKPVVGKPVGKPVDNGVAQEREPDYQEDVKMGIFPTEDHPMPIKYDPTYDPTKGWGGGKIGDKFTPIRQDPPPMGGDKRDPYQDPRGEKYRPIGGPPSGPPMVPRGEGRPRPPMDREKLLAFFQQMGMR